MSGNELNTHWMDFYHIGSGVENGTGISAAFLPKAIDRI
jgi:hypothetical protein